VSEDTVMGKGQTSKGASQVTNVCDQVRDVFRESGWTFYRLGKEAGVKPETVARFIRRERDVRGETFAKLCAALGLELTKKGE
jgi:plasmid maintenance system antidote protein VapI